MSYTYGASSSGPGTPYGPAAPAPGRSNMSVCSSIDRYTWSELEEELDLLPPPPEWLLAPAAALPLPPPPALRRWRLPATWSFPVSAPRGRQPGSPPSRMFSGSVASPTSATCSRSPTPSWKRPKCNRSTTSWRCGRCRRTPYFEQNLLPT